MYLDRIMQGTAHGEARLAQAWRVQGFLGDAWAEWEGKGVHRLKGLKSWQRQRTVGLGWRRKCYRGKEDKM